MWGDNHVRVVEPSKDSGHQGSGGFPGGQYPTRIQHVVACFNWEMLALSLPPLDGDDWKLAPCLEFLGLCP